MKTSQEKLKAEFLAEAESLFDQLMAWDEHTSEPDLTQVEEIVCAGAERVQSDSCRCVPLSSAAVSIKCGARLTIHPQIEMRPGVVSYLTKQKKNFTIEM